MPNISRGIRNNNPFNIRKSHSRWQGLVPSSDPEFCQFSTMKYGARAGLVLLRNYIKRGFDTPTKIINRFAPSTENDTDSYIRHVCYDGNYVYHLSPVDRIHDIYTLCLLASNMIKYETGFRLFQPSELVSLCHIYNIKL